MLDIGVFWSFQVSGGFQVLFFVNFLMRFFLVCFKRFLIFGGRLWELLWREDVRFYFGVWIFVGLGVLTFSSVHFIVSILVLSFFVLEGLSVAICYFSFFFVEVGRCFFFWEVRRRRGLCIECFGRTLDVFDCVGFLFVGDVSMSIACF